MRREELVAEAHRLGIKNPDCYLASELRKVVAARQINKRMGA
jgi:hypothetical protein